MSLYAVVDCAAADWLFPAVSREPQHEPLFSGALEPELRENAPHLVSLGPEAPLLALLNSDEARQAAAGCVLEAELGMAELRRSLRRKLTAMLPDGRVVMFRFFDPRVLATYLDSLTPDETAPWFNGISDWWLPMPDRTLHYRLADGRARAQVLPR